MLSALLVTFAARAFDHAGIELTAENLKQCFVARLEAGEDATAIRESLVAKITSAIEAGELAAEAANELIAAVEAL